MTSITRSTELPRASLLATIRRHLPGLDAFERVFYGGLVLTALGLTQSPLPWLAFVVPGGSLSFVALILKLRRP